MLQVQAQQSYGVGDFVLFQYSKKQEYPGTIKGKEKDEYIVEISINRKKSEGIETEMVRGKYSQIRPINV